MPDKIIDEWLEILSTNPELEWMSLMSFKLYRKLIWDEKNNKDKYFKFSFLNIFNKLTGQEIMFIWEHF